jgi:transcription elongation factor GreA
MADKKTILTYAGLKNFEQELQELKTVKRKDVAEKIKEARALGDLSENAEYDAAKEEQAEIESRIVILEKLLRNAEVIDEEELNQETVGAGSIVRLHDLEYDEEINYSIVGSTEADPFQGKISDESPLGQALLHRGVGEHVEVAAPDGVVRYTILEIQVPNAQSRRG